MMGHRASGHDVELENGPGCIRRGRQFSSPDGAMNRKGKLSIEDARLPLSAASIAADQNASVDTAYFDMYVDGAAVCIFTYIETKAALGTSTLWAKATIRGPLTW